MATSSGRLVYSTDRGRTCPKCGWPEKECRCSSRFDEAVPGKVVAHLRIEKAGRGGKTVTVVANFVGIGLTEKQQLAKAMQKACGTGGTIKDGRIEIQGDKRAEVARILTEAGFRPVFAGG